MLNSCMDLDEARDWNKRVTQFLSAWVHLNSWTPGNKCLYILSVRFHHVTTMTRMTTLHGIPPLLIVVMSNGAPMERDGGQNVHHHI